MKRQDMDSNDLGGLDRLQETFGNEKVSKDVRRKTVRELFDRIAPRYDLMNDLMSFGMHRYWKRVTAQEAAKAAAGLKGPIIDLAGGTGDIAFLVKRLLPDRKVVIADASSGMLAVAQKRSNGQVDILHAEADAMPVTDQSAAAITLAFGLRNMADPFGALKEARRMLEDGGTLLLLEFSKPDAWFAPPYNFHSRFVIPALGAMVAGDRGAYRYLVESIRLFPNADDISYELKRAGFDVVQVRKFVFGVAALHVARRARMPLVGM